MGKTSIEWTRGEDGSPGYTWNPVSGCSKVSEGCRNCYAEGIDKRFNADHKPWTAPNAAHNVRLHPERLDKPLRWKRPRKVFVNSMSDLFHDEVPDEFIWQVFRVMAECGQHTFQILTKRPERMLEILQGRCWRNFGTSSTGGDFHALIIKGEQRKSDVPFLPNVWLGVSVENQRAADERIPLLLRTPAAVRFLSCEPLLGPVDLRQWLGSRTDGIRNDNYYCPNCGYVGDGECWSIPNVGGDYSVCCPACAGPEGNEVECGILDWVIAGGESGPSARPMHPDWARSLRDQCAEARIPFLFKQWGQFVPIDMPWEQKSPADLASNERWVNIEGGSGFHGDQVWRMRRIGKKSAGRLLDGRSWDEYPVTQP